MDSIKKATAATDNTVPAPKISVAKTDSLTANSSSGK